MGLVYHFDHLTSLTGLMENTLRLDGLEGRFPMLSHGRLRTRYCRGRHADIAN